MFKRIISIVVLAVVISTAFLMSVLAAPPDPTYFTTGLADDAGYYMEFYSNGTWKGLKTPHHWNTETNDIAYCLDHPLDFPVGTQVYQSFTPTSSFSNRTMTGLYTILGHGYPNTMGGMPEEMARYATANAVRAWLAESEGIGYNFMNVSNGLIRAKDGSPGAYDWMMGLLTLAREGTNNPLDWSNYEITTDPSIVLLSLQNTQVIGSCTVNAPTGSYIIDESKLPSGFTISGYTGNDGDTLTISAPANITSDVITIQDALKATSPLSPSNIYWYQTSGGYQPLVCVDFSTNRTVFASDLTIKSTTHGRIQVIKRDKETRQYIQGAEYGIYKRDGTHVHTMVTNMFGAVQSKYLDSGDYYVQEIRAPSNYIIDGARYDVTVAINNQMHVLWLYNEPNKGQVKLLKLGVSDEPLAGAFFGVYTANDHWLEGITTDENGIALSSKIRFGSYYLQEKTPPNNYALDTTKQYFNIWDNDEVVELTFENKPISGKVKIVKRSEEGTPLVGVVFELYGSDDALIETLTTDDNGEVISGDLIFGDYYLKEVSTLPMFNLLETPIPIEIRQSGEVITLNIENTLIRGSVKIIKTSAQDSTPLEGVVFWLLDNDGEFIEERVTDSNGEIAATNLVYGDYYLQEKSVPDGFVLDDTLHPFSIINNEEIQISIQNQPIVGSVEVYFKHIDLKHELDDAYIYTDWVGEEYMPWLSDSGLNEKAIETYSFIKADYPTEQQIIDGKLTVTYWYDNSINGEWSDVYIPKTGQSFPTLNYMLSAICILLASVYIVIYANKNEPRA